MFIVVRELGLGVNYEGRGGPGCANHKEMPWICIQIQSPALEA